MESPRRAAFLVAVGVGAGVLLLSGIAVWVLPSVLPGRVLPGVVVQDVSVGGRTPDEVRAFLNALVAGDERRVRFSQGGLVVIEPAPSLLGAELDVERTLGAALLVGRDAGVHGFVERLVLLMRGGNVPAAWRVDHGAVTAYLQAEFARVLKAPSEPSWELKSNGSFVFHPGEAGTSLAWEEVARAVEDRLARGSDDPVPLAFVSVPPATPDADVRVLSAAATRIATKPLTLVADKTEVLVPVEELARWVFVPSPLGADAGAVPAEPELDRAVVERYLRNAVAPKVSRAPVDAQFAVSGNRSTFVPNQPGVELLVNESTTGILQGLASGAESITLVTRSLPPRVTVTPLMAQYGIQTLLARGETDFLGSPRNRIHNIRVGAEKYHGLLIPPGAEFSFNANLGPVDGEHGFLRELVILSNVTTPQFGGGLCQVSTTMFRAAIHTGLPITARKNHAYAVSYYGTPGFDATIYPPNPDLRFTNDTPGHLLIQTKLEGTTLAFEFWGSADGREVEVLGPFPYGRKPDGSLKATLVRKIARAGQTQRDEWQSNYKSPKLFPKVLAANAERETWEERAQRIAEKDRRAHEEFERKKAELERRTTERSSPSPTPRPTSRPNNEPDS